VNKSVDHDIGGTQLENGFIGVVSAIVFTLGLAMPGYRSDKISGQVKKIEGNMITISIGVGKMTCH